MCVLLFPCVCVLAGFPGLCRSSVWAVFAPSLASLTWCTCEFQALNASVSKMATGEAVAQEALHRLRPPGRRFGGPSFLPGPRLHPLLRIARNCPADVYFLISSDITAALLIKHGWLKERARVGRGDRRERSRVGGEEERDKERRRRRRGGEKMKRQVHPDTVGLLTSRLSLC